ncbi:MAG: helix-turn-helix transcriptional regulator [Clostridia bacterium]|nr:helix-turn-helix transcriptional regulator [Clostridia bacterium]
MKETNVLKQMGERIYHRRKLLKFTQEELAEKMCVSTQMISNLELGKKAIRPENLIKLCGVLNVSADYILTGANSNLTSEEFFSKLASLTAQEFKLITEILDYMNHNK